MRNAALSMTLAKAIDHTKLTFAEGEDETRAIERLCTEARAAGFYAVCVRPRHVRLAKKVLADSTIKVACVIGFPADKVNLDEELQQPIIGQIPTSEKLAEARTALKEGADELDWVMNVAAFKQDLQIGQHTALTEFRQAREVAGTHPVKMIIETDLLTPAEISQAALWCHAAKLDMVKTSTGMVAGGQGATLENVHRIGQTLAQAGSALKIKASGGIRDRAQALAFLEAGVSRLGTSSGLTLLKDGSAAVCAEINY